MSRNEFLKKLREALSSALEKDAIDGQIDYYDKYISEEMSKGKTEKDVIDELGDPTLIAKTIKTVTGTENVVDANASGNDSNTNSSSSGTSDDRKRKTKTYVYTSEAKTTIRCIIAFIVMFVAVMLIFRFLGILLIGTAGLAFGIGPIGILLIVIIIYLLSSRR